MNVIAEKTTGPEIGIATKKSLKFADYLAFTKLRLSLLVLFSAVIGYLIATPDFNTAEFFCLLGGGLFITIAANGINQVIEKEQDKLMKRTMTRPLPTGKMTHPEAILLILIFAVSGTALLWWGTNPLTACLSIASLILYGFVYTPLKRITSLAVFVGAFPGAFPPLLGWVAATGEVSYEAVLLFSTQFMWQFPHFWAIAWRTDAEYKKAGYIMLPFASGQSRENAFQILLYTLILIPVSIIPVAFGFMEPITGGIVLLCSLAFLYPAVQLFRTLDGKWATRLMFTAFLYLPVVQILALLNI